MRRLSWLCALVLATGCDTHGHPLTDGAPDPDAPGGGVAVLAVTPASIDFGTVVLAEPSVAAAFTFTNSGDAETGALTTAIGGANAAAFTVVDTTCAGTLTPGASCVAHLRFLPTTTGAKTGAFTVGDGAALAVGQMTGAGITGHGLAITPTLHDFGSIPIGSTSVTTFTVMNATTAKTGALGVAIAGASGGDFVTTSDTCGGTMLQPNASCTLSVAFSPATIGARTASLNVTGNPGGAVSASVFGVGVSSSTLTLTPTPYDFGSVRVGDTSFSVMFTVRNTSGGTTGALALARTGTQPGDFVKLGDQCSGQPLISGQSCTVFLYFEPGATGPRNARLTATASPGGAAEAEVSGTGTP